MKKIYYYKFDRECKCNANKNSKRHRRLKLNKKLEYRTHKHGELNQLFLELKELL
jgi:hypothetical protein